MIYWDQAGSIRVSRDEWALMHSSCSSGSSCLPCRQDAILTVSMPPLTRETTTFYLDGRKPEEEDSAQLAGNMQGLCSFVISEQTPQEPSAESLECEVAQSAAFIQQGKGSVAGDFISWLKSVRGRVGSCRSLDSKIFLKSCQASRKRIEAGFFHNMVCCPFLVLVGLLCCSLLVSNGWICTLDLTVSQG